jgi:hypothetical protein
MNGKYFTTKKVEGLNLMMFQGNIFMPKELQSHVVVARYDEYLAPPGKKYAGETLCQWFHWFSLCRDVRTFCKMCNKCQLGKKKAFRKYGHFQAKDTEIDPWTQVEIDLVGPWTIRTPSENRYLNVLPCINPEVQNSQAT